MAKVWRSVRVSDPLVESCEKFLKTKKAHKLGLIYLKDVIEYYTRKGIESEDNLG